MSIVEQTEIPYDLLKDTTPFFELDGLSDQSLELVERRRAVGKHTVRDVCEIQVDRVQMSDGSEYDVQLIDPVRKEADVVLTYTTPWLTSLGGMNTYLGIEAAKHGMTSVAISNEQSGIGRAIRNIGHVNLAHDALVHHLVLDEVEGDGRFEPGRAITTGYSRGAMVGFGIESRKLAKSFGRRIEYNDFVDPCIEHRPELGTWNPLGLAPYLEHEVLELAKNIGHYKPKEVWHMLKTVPTSAPQFLQHFATMFALFSGEAGELADQMPNDVPMYLTLYVGSKFNHSSSWYEKFTNRYQRIYIKSELGSHLTGADPEVMRETVGRLALIQGLLREGATRTEIDPTVIFGNLH